MLLKEGEVFLRGSEKYQPAKGWYSQSQFLQCNNLTTSLLVVDANEWAAEIDKKIADRLANPFDPRNLSGEKYLDTVVDMHYLKYSEQIGEAKVKCQVEDCHKMFKGFEFIKKHLKLKHANLFTREVRPHTYCIIAPNNNVMLIPQTDGRRGHV